MTDDWNEVAKRLYKGVRHSLQPENQEALDAAISLCKRFAAGELVERSELRKYTHENPCRCFQCTGVDRDC